MGCAASTKSSKNTIHPPTKMVNGEDGNQNEKNINNTKKSKKKNKKKNKSMMGTRRDEKGIEVSDEEAPELRDRKARKRVDGDRNGKKKPLRFNSTKMKNSGANPRDRGVDKLFPMHKRLPSNMSLSNLSEPSQAKDLDLIEDTSSIYKISGKKGHYQKMKKGMKKGSKKGMKKRVRKE